MKVISYFGVIVGFTGLITFTVLLTDQIYGRMVNLPTSEKFHADTDTEAIILSCMVIVMCIIIIFGYGYPLILNSKKDTVMGNKIATYEDVYAEE